MHWNIRVMNCPSENGGEDLLSFKEVYYEDDGRPTSYTEPFICSEDRQGLETILKRMQNALSRPTLHEDQFKGSVTPKPLTQNS